VSPLNLLRQLVDQQQHEVLKLQVVSYLDDSHDIQAFPLKALAHAYLGERAEAEQALVTALQSIAELDDALMLYQKSFALNSNRLPVWSALIRLFIETKQGQSAQDALDNGIACLKEIHTQLPETAVEQFTEQHVG